MSQTIPTFRLKLLLLAIVFLPSLIMMAAQASSQALGLVLAIMPLFVWGVMAHVLPKPGMPREHTGYLALTLVWMYLICIHYALVGILFQLVQDPAKLFGSLALLFGMLIAARLLAQQLTVLREITLQNILRLIMRLLIINALVSLSGIDFFGNASPKPCFLFSEPSHFALATAPFLIYHVAARRHPILLLAFFTAWGMYIENLTMLIVVMLAALTIIDFKKVLFILIPTLIAVPALIDLNYYADRISFSTGSSNLSALVYMQGWENAYLALRDTAGLGIGFQQFGIANATGDATARILYITGDNYNLFDGGSTASKLVAEFGIFGMLGMLMLMARGFRSLMIIKHRRLSPLQLLAHSIMVAFLIELLIRGGGYFSEGVFFYLTSSFLLAKLKHQSASHDNHLPNTYHTQSYSHTIHQQH